MKMKSFIVQIRMLGYVYICLLQKCYDEASLFVFAVHWRHFSLRSKDEYETNPERSSHTQSLDVFGVQQTLKAISYFQRGL